MNFVAEIKIMPLKELLDPQGKAVLGGLANLGIKSINDVRIGKHIQLDRSGTARRSAGHCRRSIKKVIGKPCNGRIYHSN